jgi:hypothetical protein
MKNKLLTLLVGLCAMSGFAQNPPANDDPANAIQLTVNEGQLCSAPVAIQLEYSTLSTAGEACPIVLTGPIGGDVWVKFTATKSTHLIRLSDFSPTASLMAAIYTDFSLPSQECLNYIPTTGGSFQNLIPGNEYYVRLFFAVGGEIDPDFGICVLTPAEPISVTNDQYTTEELVTDVLVNSSCLDISNITSSTGVNFNPSFPNGIAYFEKGNSDFPFNSGIVLCTGDAMLIPGPNTSVLSTSPGWEGDDDLIPFMSGTPAPNSVTDATKLEFDFVPVIDNIQFNFLFASEEYGTFQCTYSDAFAFFLTDIDTGVTSNLAVIPNTTTPITVVTVNNATYNPNCPSSNPDYFGNFYVDNPMSAPVNFNGTTIPLTAQSAVTPGHQYHIKMVIGDRIDHAFDSAVFIDAGSFNIGAADGNGVALTSSNGNVFCGGGSTELSLSEFIPGASYLWSTGETTPTITVNQPGAYSLALSLSGEGACSISYSITIIEAGLDQLTVTDYPVFDDGGQYIFNFDTKTAQIENFLGGIDYVITYHLSLADAEVNINPLPTLYTNTANPQTIYVRVQNEGNNCYVTASFVLVVLDENYQTPAPTGATSQILSEGQTLGDIVIDGENIQWYPTSGETPGPPSTLAEEPLPLTTLLVDGTTYYASQTIYGIESVERLPVTVHFTAMGIQDNVFAGLKVYPNPATSVINISNTTAINEVAIYNFLGQSVLNKSVSGNNAEINVENLSNGIYVLKIKSGSNQSTIKFTKK